MSELLKDYLSRKALADEIGRTEKTLIRWEVEGKGPPATRVGRKVLYFRPSVEKWLRKRERVVAP